jgi:hypothetical protein
LKDGKLDMILPEDSAEAYDKVCSELGYDRLGVPVSEEHALKFEEYRKCGDLGPVIVASVQRVLCCPHESVIRAFLVRILATGCVRASH